MENIAEVIDFLEVSNIKNSESKNTELFKAIHRSQHCQRNYDLSKTMPTEDIKTIVTAATQCPSKQNIAFYKLHVVVNRNKINQIYECCSGKDATGMDFPQNPQVLGNLVLVFEHYENYDNSGKNSNPETKLQDEASLRVLSQDRFTALGIAAGYVNLVSSQLGYATGCCSCILDYSKLQETIGGENTPLLVMGIGFKQKNKNRRVHHLKDDVVFGTRKKQSIEINYIN